MAAHDKLDRYQFLIPPASAGHVIALGCASLVVSAILLIPLVLGGRYNEPVFAVLLLGISPLVAFFLLLAFPPRSWRARVEFNHNLIRYIPVPPLRWIGEPEISLLIGAETREVLICRGSRDKYGGFFADDPRDFPYGFRAILRAGDGRDRKIEIKTGNRLNSNQAQALINGIAGATGIPARLVKRQSREDGTIEEVPWIPDAHSTRPTVLARVVFAATPLLGGAVVGLSRASGAQAALVGLILWLAQTAITFILSQPVKQPRIAWPYWFTTAITFAASYAVVFLITANTLRAR